MATSATRQQILNAKARHDINPVLGNFVPIGSHAQDTTISSATTISASDDMATHIMLQNSSATVNVRYTLDGTTPTSTLGFLLEPGWYAIIPVTDTTINVIETAASGQVDYQEMIGK